MLTRKRMRHTESALFDGINKRIKGNHNEFMKEGTHSGSYYMDIYISGAGNHGTGLCGIPGKLL